MLPQQHIDQANHNIEFLTSFYKAYKFNDWAITVSFYESIHIVEAAICKSKKLKIAGVEVPDITDSNLLYRSIKNGKITPPENFNNTIHNTRTLLVTENFEDISGYYEMLHNDATTARYKQFMWDDNKCNLSIIALNGIIQWANEKFGFKVITTTTEKK